MTLADEEIISPDGLRIKRQLAMIEILQPGTKSLQLEIADVPIAAESKAPTDNDDNCLTAVDGQRSRSSTNLGSSSISLAGSSSRFVEHIDENEVNNWSEEAPQRSKWDQVGSRLSEIYKVIPKNPYYQQAAPESRAVSAPDCRSSGAADMTGAHNLDDNIYINSIPSKNLIIRKVKSYDHGEENETDYGTDTVDSSSYQETLFYDYDHDYVPGCLSHLWQRFKYWISG